VQESGAPRNVTARRLHAGIHGREERASRATSQGDRMDHLAEMLQTHPHPASSAGDEAQACIEAAAECAHVCTVCADACLAEDDVAGLEACIRLNLDCADICALTSRLIARPSRRDEPTLEAMLQACARICRACAEECAAHAAHMEHCRVCAESCRSCAEACDRMAAALVP
jgi:hypothetical protein